VVWIPADQLADISAFESVGVELLAGDPAAAGAFGAERFQLHESMGDLNFLPGAALGPSGRRSRRVSSRTALTTSLPDRPRWGRSGERSVGQHQVKEPTEPVGTRRDSWDLSLDVG
jgi:hypothetical protein